MLQASRGMLKRKPTCNNLECAELHLHSFHSCKWGQNSERDYVIAWTIFWIRYNSRDGHL